ncbi:MAG: GNAT family N-acetyltransferase [Chloroflexota bacterium]
MIERPYAGADDLPRLQHFNAQNIAMNPAGWLHPGDVPHRLYNGLRRHNPAGWVRVWEDGDEIIGWALLNPRGEFDVQTRDVEVMAEAVAWARRNVGDSVPYLSIDLWRAGDHRANPLYMLNFVRAKDEEPYVLRERDLNTPLADAPLPDGFTIRTARDTSDAAGLATVHAGAFGSEWTAESYARVMQSPGYDPTREWVVVAPNGDFAAFCVTWIDAVNSTGYFEPVGTHRDYWRRGLAKALMTAVMQRWHDDGLATALVVHEPPEENLASAKLYAGLGFEVLSLLDLYHGSLIR